MSYLLLLVLFYATDSPITASSKDSFYDYYVYACEERSNLFMRRLLKTRSAGVWRENLFSRAMGLQRSK